MTQPVRAVALLPAVLALALAACGGDEKTAAPPLRPVRLMTVAAGDAVPPVELAGTVQARVESRMGFRVAGKIIGRQVEVGQHVQKGEELMRLDARDFQLADNAARSAVASAHANLDVAQSEFRRFSDLRAKGFVSQTDLDRKRNELAAAQMQLDNARSSAALEGNHVGDTALRADADGVVAALTADVGEVVAAGQPVLTLARDGAREVEVEFPENRAALAHAAAAEVALWASPNDWHAAGLREISAVADPVARTFRARYSVQAAPGALALGQSATLRLHLPAIAAKAGVYVPLSALYEAGGKTSVWRFDANTGSVATLPVQVLGVDGNRVLLAGLPPGAQIVTAGVHVLAEGQKVRPMDVAGVAAAN
jgi:RND family efflux transporter MFP subunit